MVRRALVEEPRDRLPVADGERVEESGAGHAIGVVELADETQVEEHDAARR